MNENGFNNTRATIKDVAVKANVSLSTVSRALREPDKTPAETVSKVRAADAIRCAHIEAASVFNGIGIVKLMGRESGFIAANASLSMREVNFVLVPEVPFSLYGERGLFPALEKCLAAHSHAVLAVAEGAGQDLLSEHETRCDASGNKALGDITGFLRAKIAEYFSAKKIPYYLKYIDPSYMRGT